MLKHLVRPEIVRLEAYDLELSNRQIAKAMGLHESQILRFDTNTSPYTPKELLSNLALEVRDYPVNEYSDTSYAELPPLAAEYTQTDKDMIVIGAGADECLDIVAKTFLSNGTEVILPIPTYAMFRVTTEISGAQSWEVLRQVDFSVDIESVLNNIRPNIRMIFLCNPNNPTANPTPRKDIELLLEQTRCLVLVDEAYFEFYGKSVVDLTYEFENLVVIRSLSKAFSMAAMRVAYLVANRKTVQMLNKVRPPTSVSVFSVMMAQAALSQPHTIKNMAQTLVQERKQLQEKLNRLENIITYPSETNFVLLRFNKLPARDVHHALMKKGLVTRDVSGLPLLENCLRISVRTKEDDSYLFESLKEVIELKYPI